MIITILINFINFLWVFHVPLKNLQNKSIIKLKDLLELEKNLRVNQKLIAQKK